MHSDMSDMQHGVETLIKCQTSTFSWVRWREGGRMKFRPVFSLWSFSRSTTDFWSLLFNINCILVFMTQTKKRNSKTSQMPITYKKVKTYKRRNLIKDRHNEITYPINSYPIITWSPLLLKSKHSIIKGLSCIKVNCYKSTCGRKK